MQTIHLRKDLGPESVKNAYESKEVRKKSKMGQIFEYTVHQRHMDANKTIKNAQHH